MLTGLTCRIGVWAQSAFKKTLESFYLQLPYCWGKDILQMVNIAFSYETSRSVTLVFTKKTSVFTSLSLEMDGFSFSSDCSWQKNVLNG